VAAGAACCGAGAAVPGLLTDEERARVTVATRFLRLVGVSDESGQLLADDGWKDDTLLFHVEAATLLGDRWSLGARLGLGRHSLPVADDQTVASGIGDVTAVLSYEWLPEWTSRSGPRGVGFLALTAPTGVADPQSAAPLGRGYWSLALGSSFTKTLGDFDLFAVPQAGFGVRQVGNFPGGEREWTAALALGAGWTVPRVPLRLTLRFDPQVRWPSGLPERWVTPFVADVSVLLGDEWRLAVTYEDQTLFPLHRNASLGRGVAVALVHRWLR
jgi:hypothetical protein